MTIENQFSLEYFKSKLNYNPDIGIFIWKFKDSNTKGEKIFNGQYAGKEAGGKDKDGYIVIRINDRLIFAHRIAYLFMTGEWPKEQIDHINGIKDDNSWRNLRSVSHMENLKNQKISNRNTSGVRGINWSKKENKWRARINFDGKQINLGFFENFNEAIKIRKEAEKKYKYHPNHGRKN